MYTNLLIEQDQSICIITINRPTKMNALNFETIEQLDAAVRSAQTDQTITGIIITGVGEKAFVAGADIAQLKTLSPQQAITLSQKGQIAFRNIETSPKPIVAAVNGFALGGGCELAMACQFRLASTNAKFGQPEVNLGTMPGYGGTQRLPRLIGRGKATELLLTGDAIDANEALRLGLVNYVTQLEDLLPRCKEILNKIATKAPLAIARTIESIDAYYLKPTDGFELESNLFGSTFATNDFQEGTDAFLNKRKPDFKGN